VRLDRSYHLKDQVPWGVGVVRQLNIDDCVITMRNQIGALSRTTLRSRGGMIDSDTLVQHAGVGVSYHADSNSFLLGRLVRQY